MIAHTSLAVSNFPRSRSFFSRILAPLGYRANMEYDDATGFNDGKNTDFWIAKKRKVVPTHIAFEASGRAIPTATMSRQCGTTTARRKTGEENVCSGGAACLAETPECSEGLFDLVIVPPGRRPGDQ
jgi:catechol 2,3-dioxygenase-like lactoylglutathione lyase family enzyme